jgi:hypothetical protein
MAINPVRLRLTVKQDQASYSIAIEGIKRGHVGIATCHNGKSTGNSSIGCRSGMRIGSTGAIAPDGRSLLSSFCKILFLQARFCCVASGM